MSKKNNCPQECNPALEIVGFVSIGLAIVGVLVGVLVWAGSVNRQLRELNLELEAQGRSIAINRREFINLSYEFKGRTMDYVDEKCRGSK